MAAFNWRVYAVFDISDWTGYTVFDLGKTVKEGLEKNGMIGWQFNTIGV